MLMLHLWESQELLLHPTDGSRALELWEGPPCPSVGLSALAGGWSSSCCPPTVLPKPHQNSDFYVPDELRLQSSFCGGGCSWDTGTAKTLPNGGWRILFWFCSANKRAEGGGLKGRVSLGFWAIKGSLDDLIQLPIYHGLLNSIWGTGAKMSHPERS